MTEVKHCAVCSCESVTPVCDSCRHIFRRNGVIVEDEEDLKYWKEWVDSPAVERKIQKELYDSINY